MCGLTSILENILCAFERCILLLLEFSVCVHLAHLSYSIIQEQYFHINFLSG